MLREHNQSGTKEGQTWQTWPGLVTPGLTHLGDLKPKTVVGSSHCPGRPCTQIFLSKLQSTELPESDQLSHLSNRDSSRSSQPLCSLPLSLRRRNYSSCVLKLQLCRRLKLTDLRLACHVNSFSNWYMHLHQSSLLNAPRYYLQKMTIMSNGHWLIVWLTLYQQRWKLLISSY